MLFGPIQSRSLASLSDGGDCWALLLHIVRSIVNVLKCVYYLFISRPGFAITNNHRRNWGEDGWMVGWTWTDADDDDIVIVSANLLVSLLFAHRNVLPNRIINIYSLWLRFARWQQCTDDDGDALLLLLLLHPPALLLTALSKPLLGHHPSTPSRPLPIECLFGQSTNNADGSLLILSLGYFHFSDISTFIGSCWRKHTHPPTATTEQYWATTCI